jgi:hypothetical protein
LPANCAGDQNCTESVLKKTRATLNVKSKNTNIIIHVSAIIGKATARRFRDREAVGAAIIAGSAMQRIVGWAKRSVPTIEIKRVLVGTARSARLCPPCETCGSPACAVKKKTPAQSG